MTWNVFTTDFYYGFLLRINAFTYTFLGNARSMTRNVFTTDFYYGFYYGFTTDQRIYICLSWKRSVGLFTLARSFYVHGRYHCREMGNCSW